MSFHLPSYVQLDAPLALTALRTFLLLLDPIIIMYLITPTTIFDTVFDNFPNTLLADLRSRRVSSRPHIVAWREENSSQLQNMHSYIHTYSTTMPTVIYSKVLLIFNLLCIFGNFSIISSLHGIKQIHNSWPTHWLQPVIDSQWVHSLQWSSYLWMHLKESTTTVQGA